VGGGDDTQYTHTRVTSRTCLRLMPRKCISLTSRCESIVLEGGIIVDDALVAVDCLLVASVSSSPASRSLSCSDDSSACSHRAKSGTSLVCSQCVARSRLTLSAWSLSARNDENASLLSAVQKRDTSSMRSCLYLCVQRHVAITTDIAMTYRYSAPRRVDVVGCCCCCAVLSPPAAAAGREPYASGGHTRAQSTT
jgi:hypothetical protein